MKPQFSLPVLLFALVTLAVPAQAALPECIAMYDAIQTKKVGVIEGRAYLASTVPSHMVKNANVDEVKAFVTNLRFSSGMNLDDTYFKQLALADQPATRLLMPSYFTFTQKSAEELKKAEAAIQRDEEQFAEQCIVKS